MRFGNILLVLFWSCNLFAQNLTVLTTLSDTVSENSGLLSLNDKWITHNDSGGEPALFEIDSLNGHILRKVVIQNASNIDWEALAADDDHIYIADIGNNNGTRTDLRIYRILRSEYFNTQNDTVSADTISFVYADQVDFSPQPQATDHDAEALITMNDSLLIFTKNWLNNWTNVYSLPKDPGTYIASRVDSLNSQGLVTGADHINGSDKVVLCGYFFISPFIMEITQFGNGSLSSGVIDRYNISPSHSVQIEGIVSSSLDRHYLGSEDNFTGPSSLYILTSSPTGIIAQITMDLTVYPNPASNKVWFNVPSAFDPALLSIYDSRGILVMNESVDVVEFRTNYEFDISLLDIGIYLLTLKDDNGTALVTVRLVKQ